VRAAIKHCCHYRKSFTELNSKTPAIHVIIWDTYMLSMYEITRWLTTDERAEWGFEQCDLNFYCASSLGIKYSRFVLSYINIVFLRAPYHHPKHWDVKVLDKINAEIMVEATWRSVSQNVSVSCMCCAPLWMLCTIVIVVYHVCTSM